PEKRQDQAGGENESVLQPGPLRPSVQRLLEPTRQETNAECQVARAEKQVPEGQQRLDQSALQRPGGGPNGEKKEQGFQDQSVSNGPAQRGFAGTKPDPINERVDQVAPGDRLLQLSGEFGGIAKPLSRPLGGGLFIAEPSRFLLEDSADVGQ